MRFKLFFKWFDFWVGLFWDADKKRLYIIPIPMLGFHITFKTRCIHCNVRTFQPHSDCYKVKNI